MALSSSYGQNRSTRMPKEMMVTYSHNSLHGAAPLVRCMYVVCLKFCRLRLLAAQPSLLQPVALLLNICTLQQEAGGVALGDPLLRTRLQLCMLPLVSQLDGYIEDETFENTLILLILEVELSAHAEVDSCTRGAPPSKNNFITSNSLTKRNNILHVALLLQSSVFFIFVFRPSFFLRSKSSVSCTRFLSLRTACTT